MRRMLSDVVGKGVGEFVERWEGLCEGAKEGRLSDVANSKDWSSSSSSSSCPSPTEPIPNLRSNFNGLRLLALLSSFGVSAGALVTLMGPY
mmetsp:Transcript_56975/g.114255  ORF Transcript_56975/g.114255 Transcript_56975/m.114255 type:complete len:91 (+) Transcript_56975:335-607(+)